MYYISIFGLRLFFWGWMEMLEYQNDEVSKKKTRIYQMPTIEILIIIIVYVQQEKEKE